MIWGGMLLCAIEVGEIGEEAMEKRGDGIGLF